MFLLHVFSIVMNWHIFALSVITVLKILKIPSPNDTDLNLHNITNEEVALFISFPEQSMAP